MPISNQVINPDAGWRAFVPAASAGGLAELGRAGGKTAGATSASGLLEMPRCILDRFKEYQMYLPAKGPRRNLPGDTSWLE
jgi:hypothetical protein